MIYQLGQSVWLMIADITVSKGNQLRLEDLGRKIEATLESVHKKLALPQAVQLSIFLRKIGSAAPLRGT